MSRYGYIGLGMMGSAMAENLIGTGAEVTVYDVDPAAVDAAVALGAAAADSPAQVAAASDAVSVCVPAAEHLDQVLDGPGGLAEGVGGSPGGLAEGSRGSPGKLTEKASGSPGGLAEGSRGGPGGLAERASESLGGLAEGSRGKPAILVHSTVHPDTIRAARDRAASWGVPLFDACVAGGAASARTGDLILLAGGLGQMPGPARTLLDVYAAHVIDAGPVGAGAALKIAINVMTYAQFAAAATAHDLTAAQGADPALLAEAWRAMGQLGSLTEQYQALVGLRPEQITGDFRESLEALADIGRKDLALALELGPTRSGTAAVLKALHGAMDAVYNVDEEAR